MGDFARFREELRKEINEFKSKLERELRTEIRELKKSQEFLNDQFEGIKNEHSKLIKENKALRQENEKLLTECEALKSENFQHEQRITASEQYSRRCNIEIKGVPQSKDESLPNILHEIGMLLNEPITGTDVEVCHRVPCKNVKAIPNIIVQFKSRPKRDTVLQKAKKTRMSTENLGHASISPIFINEHLCPAMKQLLGKAVARKKEKGWRFAWTVGGKILARKEETSTVLHIRDLRDVEKIV